MTEAENFNRIMAGLAEMADIAEGRADSVTIQPIPPGDHLLPVMLEEAATFAATHGQVITVTHGDQLFRVMEPWEDGTDAALSSDKG
jgi:hypothetical protein